jgi:DNA adenine methylase
LDDPDVMRQHFERLLWDDAADPALRYLLLNRCSFNGRVRLDDPWRHRTYFSKPNGMNIVTRGDHLAQAAALLRDAKVTSTDFEVLFDEAGTDVVVFADPPYVRDTELSQSAKLYEKGFTLADHRRLKRCVDRCAHKVVLTYDDHPLIRDLYRGYRIADAAWTYKGNSKRPVGRELFITNFGATAADIARAA